MLEDVPEIVELVGTASAKQVMEIDERGGDTADKAKTALRSVFTQLMSASKEMTTKAISKLKSRLLLQSQVCTNFIIINHFFLKLTKSSISMLNLNIDYWCLIRTASYSN